MSAPKAVIQSQVTEPHTHTHPHIHTHAHTHTCTHMHTHTCTHMHIHTHHTCTHHSLCIFRCVLVGSGSHNLVFVAGSGSNNLVVFVAGSGSHNLVVFVAGSDSHHLSSWPQKPYGLRPNVICSGQHWDHCPSHCLWR